MKRLKTILSLTIMLVCFISALSLPANAATTALDEIQDYTMTVHMRPDGTMDIKYHVEWKVLNDSKEGPLEWVKIGNPNKHVDEITALSDNIKEIKYTNDGGSYIRVDFNRAYYKNETVTFEYTIHQSYMYIIEEDSHLCRYSFTPGWFEEIAVKSITIKWSDANVIESTAHKHEDGYLIWNASLDMGERLNASVKYNLDTFTTNKNEQYTEDSGSSGWWLAIIIVIVIIVIIAMVVIVTSDGYDSHGGFGGGRSTIFVHSSCARSSCACASCACACACAGGGRAGCSKKDFYKTNLKSNDLKKELSKKE